MILHFSGYIRTYVR